MAKDKKQIASECWATGGKAVNTGDFDYAIAMFQKSVEFVPENLVYRQSLRLAQFKKFDNNKKGEGMWAKRKLVPIRSKVAKAVAKQEWDAVDLACEEGLAINPWDTALNISLGDSCSERGYDEIAVFSYKIACDADPKNRGNLAKLARLLSQQEKYDEAINVWINIQKLDPQDKEARSMITKLQADKMIDKGGYEGAETTKDVLPAHEINKRLNVNPKKKGPDGPGQSEEADLQRQIRKDPDDYNLHLKLGDLYTKLDKNDEALEAYRNANEKKGGDSSIEEIIEDTELLILRKKRDSTIQKVNDGNKELIQEANDLKNQHRDKEIEVYAKRVIAYPQDLQLKHKLGKLYSKTKKWSDAIPLLQQASSDVRLEIDSVSTLGKCFLQLKKPTLALKQFKRVLPKISFEDHADLFKEVHYFTAWIYEKSEDYTLAEEHYGEVLSVDYEYRDVKDRMEKLPS